MRKLIKAVGAGEANANSGDHDIERTLAKRPPVNIGYGRLVTTVSDLDEIKTKLKDGYEILWCQMSKLVPGERHKGENDG